MENYNCSILGCLPVTLLTESVSNSTFLSIHCNIRSRLTIICCPNSSYPRYTSHCFDIRTNLAANNEYTQLILNSGLSIDNKSGDIGLRGKCYTALPKSVDNKKWSKTFASLKSMPHWIIF